MASEELIIKAKPLRSKLLKAAEYLWTDDMKLGDIVANIRSGHAYVNQADDMGNLTRLFIDNWKQADGQCKVTKEDVVKAQELGAQFLADLSKVKTESITELKDLQLRAGEYLRRGIDDIRTAAAFVFSRDKERLSRYPLIRKAKRRATDKTQGEPENHEEIIEQPGAPEPVSPVTPQAPTIH